MVKKCKDPICPANKRPSASHGEPKNGGPKKSKKVSSNGAISRENSRKKSKNKKPKHRLKGRKRSTTIDSDVKICKNKKCQTLPATMESSTSTSPSPKTRVRSMPWNKLSNWKRQKCRDKETICCCDDHEKMATGNSQNRRDRKKKKHKRRRENIQKNKCMASLCICVRQSDSES